MDLRNINNLVFMQRKLTEAKDTSEILPDEDMPGEEANGMSEVEAFDSKSVLDGFFHSSDKLKRFIRTNIGKEIMTALDDLLHGGVTYKQRSLLQDHVFVKGSSFFIKNQEGNDIGTLPSKFAIRLKEKVSRAENRTEEFSEIFEEISEKWAKRGKKVNSRVMGTEALIGVFERYKNNPGSLPRGWQNQFSKIGIDITSSLKIIHQKSKIDGYDIFDEETSVKVTPKATVTINQNEISIKACVIYSNSEHEIVSEWTVDDIDRYIREKIEITEDEQAGVESFVTNTSTLSEKDSVVGISEFFRSPVGRQFLIDQLTTITQKGVVPEEEIVTHIFIIGSDGKFNIFSPIEYIDTLQSLGVGTCGCGFNLELSGGKLIFKEV